MEKDLLWEQFRKGFMMRGFKCEAVVEGGFRNIRLIPMKNYLRTHFVIDSRGEITFAGTTNQLLDNTLPFIRRERISNAKQIWMKKDGQIYSIDLVKAIRYAFPVFCEEMEIYQNQVLYTEKMYAILKEGKKKLKWS